MRRTRTLKLFSIFFIVLMAVCATAFSAQAETARDITSQCKFTAKHKRDKLKRLYDNSYTTVYESGTGTSAAIKVAVPEGEEVGFVYIKWSGKPVGVQLQVDNGSALETVATCNDPFLASYIPVPEGVGSFQLIQATGVRDKMRIAELRVYSRGDVPADIQRWEAPYEQCDMLVISTHPDDELIFFGGTIPYYGKELGKAVQVAYIVPATAYRCLELLDGLWHCGVTHYPDIASFKDAYSPGRDKILKAWNKDRLTRHIATLYRRYTPAVVVTHDLGGEYGHGAHKAVSYIACEAVAAAADPAYSNTKKKAETLGPWQISKLYLHLYEENTLKMNWRVPLDAFGGKTAFDVAEEAFEFHVSQLASEKYHVEDAGPYDNGLFGLYFTNVGQDESRDDFFEHIGSR